MERGIREVSLDQNGWPEPPKQKPEHSMIKILASVAFVVAFVWMAAELTWGGNPDAPKNPGLERSLDNLESTEVDTEPTELPDPDDVHGVTLYSFNEVWDNYSETERDDACSAVDLLGTEQAAEEMAGGAGNSSDLDWELMARLLKMECDFR